MIRKIKCKDDFFLDLNCGKMGGIISRFAASMETVSGIIGRTLEISFVSPAGFSFGDAITEGWPADEHTVNICDDGWMSNSDSNVKFSDDMFLTLANTLFHEYAHYVHDTMGTKDTSIWPSRISTIGNNLYYKDLWHVFPHDIAAERDGILMLWTELDKIYSERVKTQDFGGDESKDVPLADALMTRHIAKHIEASEKGYVHKYMLSSSDLPVGVLTRDDVCKIFDAVLVKTLGSEMSYMRSPKGYNGDVNRLLEMNQRSRLPYNEFVTTLLNAESGFAMDKMIATAAVHLHPEIKSSFPNVDFSELTFENTFGKAFPETSEESRKRLGISGNINDKGALNIYNANDAQADADDDFDIEL